MLEQEKVIKVFISTDDVSNEKGDYHYIVKGIDNLFYVADSLRFNGGDAIYIHLDTPISIEQMNYNLVMLCKLLIDKGLVNTAMFSRMPLPIERGRYNTTFGDNNMLKSGRLTVFLQEQGKTETVANEKGQTEQ